MASYESMEMALDQIAFHLTAELGGELDKITHERNDGVVLPLPAMIETAIVPIDKYPAVYVLPARSVPQALTSAGTIADHTVHIEAILANSDQRELQRQRMRYLTAIKRVLLRLHRIELNGAQTAYSCEWQEDDYGDGLPVLDRDSGETVDSVAVRLALQADEA